MTEFFEAVVEFNQQVLGIRQRKLGFMQSEEEAITLHCLEEERNELYTAMQEGDFVGQVDALIDNIYFAVGALYKLGLTAERINACAMAVHKANITKKKGVNAKRATGAADAVKPADWVSPEQRIAEILGVPQ